MIILVTGGSCSGKTTFAKGFGSDSVVISMDDFYKGKSQMKPPYNFDEPAAFDIDELTRAILALEAGKVATIPRYSMKKSERIGSRKVKPATHTIVEGICAFLLPEIIEKARLKVFVDTPLEERVKRRIIRDIERGRTALETLEYSVQVEKMHEIYVEPQRKYADLIVRG